MGFPLISLGNGAYVGTVASHVPPYFEHHKVTINNTYSRDLVINELADYGDGYTTFPANTTTSYYYDIDEGSEVDEIIENAIDGYTTRYIFTSEDVVEVDQTKYCWVGGKIQTSTIPYSSEGMYGPVIFGYANGIDPTEPGWDYIPVLTHYCCYADQRQSGQFITPMTVTGDMISSSVGGQGAYESYRICVDTHGRDIYDTTPAGQIYLRNKLGALSNVQFSLDSDVGNQGTIGWSNVCYQGVTTTATTVQRKFDLNIARGSFIYNTSTMLKDAAILNAMTLDNSPYIYPYVNLAYPFTGTLPAGTTAAYILEDEDNPEGDWGWVAEKPDFSNLMEVNVDGRWKGVKSAKVYVNGQWKDVVDYKVYQNGQWKHGSASTQIGLY